MIKKPIEIYTIADLKKVEQNLNAVYILMNSLDFKKLNWDPIGGYFRGIFNGNRNSIKNLKIRISDECAAGLFSSIGARGTIKNLTLTDVDIIGNHRVGGLAGLAYSSNIQNIKITGKIIGKRYVGGLVGDGSYGSKILNCNIQCSVKGEKYVGGLIGKGDDENAETIHNVVLKVKVKGKENVGLFFGNAPEYKNSIGEGEVNDKHKLVIHK